MAKGDLSYYRNAGMAPRKIEPQKSIIPKFVVDVASDVMSAPKVMKEKVKGMMADNARGSLLYKQGYGKYYDSAGKIAKAGKSAGKQRSAK